MGIYIKKKETRSVLPRPETAAPVETDGQEVQAWRFEENEEEENEPRPHTEKLQSLTGIDRVRFCDYSAYRADTCRNGGNYGFWADYRRNRKGAFDVTHGCTAQLDFSFCPYCGQFISGDHECDHQTIAEAELLQMMAAEEPEECWREW